MKKESLLSREELALLFPNLPDLIEIHSKPLPARILLSPGNTPLQWEPRVSHVAHGCPRLLCGHPPFGAALLMASYHLAALASPFPLLGAIQSLVFPGSANARVWDACSVPSPWRSMLWVSRSLTHCIREGSDGSPSCLHPCWRAGRAPLGQAAQRVLTPTSGGWPRRPVHVSPVCLSHPHSDSLSESMKKLREEGPIIKEIGDLMLSRVREDRGGRAPKGHLLVPQCGGGDIFRGRWR